MQSHTRMRTPTHPHKHAHTHTRTLQACNAVCPGWARLRSCCLLAFYPPALWSFPGGYHSLAGRHVHSHINIKGKYEPSSAYANNKWSLICCLWVWSIMFTICCLRCHRDSDGVVCVRIKHPIFILKDCFIFWHKKLMQKKQSTNIKFLFSGQMTKQ